MPRPALPNRLPDEPGAADLRDGGDCEKGDGAGDVHGARKLPPRHQNRHNAHGYEKPVFLFFSNRLGCAGSLAVSAIATLTLLAVLGVIDTG